MNLERYCICGAVLKADVPQRRKQRVLMGWYDRHTGDGHGDTDAAGAEMARMGFGQPMGREAKRNGQR